MNPSQRLTAEVANSARFWAKVAKSDNGCWLWKGAKDKQGYGMVRLPQFRRTPVPAHRVAYALAHGSVTEGMLVMHACDNPQCVNPAHLSLGTHRDNMLDMMRKERSVSHTRFRSMEELPQSGNFLACVGGKWINPNSGKTHCVHGHAFDEGNTIWRTRHGKPHRECRACQREWANRKYHARKAQRRRQRQG